MSSSHESTVALAPSVSLSRTAPAIAETASRMPTPALTADVVETYTALHEHGVLGTMRQLGPLPYQRRIEVVDGRPEIGFTDPEVSVFLVPQRNQQGAADGTYRLAMRGSSPGQWTSLPARAVATDGGLSLRSTDGTCTLDLHAPSRGLPEAPASPITSITTLRAELPDGQVVQWRSNTRVSSGAWASGWSAEMERGAERVPVFVKTLRTAEDFERLSQSQRALSVAISHNPAAKPFVSESHFLGAAPDVATQSRRPVVGVSVDEQVRGPTLKQWGEGTARHGEIPLGPIEPRQLAAIGCLVASGLRALNLNSPLGARVVFPDATKPDNVMVPAAAIDPTAGWIPREVKFIDKDSAIAERDIALNRNVAGHQFYADFTTIFAMGKQASLDQVDQAHSYQVGRMLLGTMLGGNLPDAAAGQATQTQGAAETVPKPWAEYLVMRTPAYTERCIQQVQATMAMRPGDGGAELLSLVRQCSDPDPTKRPSLRAIVHTCERICAEQGTPIRRGVVR